MAGVGGQVFGGKLLSKSMTGRIVFVACACFYIAEDAEY